MDNKRRIVGWTALCLALVAALGSIADWNPLSGMIAHAAWAEADRPHVLLVNAQNPLPEGYEPGELVNLFEQKRHFRLASSDLYLERETFEAANRMFKQAEDEELNGFILTSGYRSVEKQAEIFADSAENTAQEPGYSEHQTGMAFDVTAYSDDGSFESTEQFAWLEEHCWEYGFILRYPEGKESITGIDYEPWHYRYVGLEAAAIIHETGWTLEEYCEN